MYRTCPGVRRRSPLSVGEETLGARLSDFRDVPNSAVQDTFSTRPVIPNDQTLPVLTASSGMCHYRKFRRDRQPCGTVTTSAQELVKDDTPATWLGDGGERTHGIHELARMGRPPQSSHPRCRLQKGSIRACFANDRASSFECRWDASEDCCR